jgi:hypothetical protein
VDLVRQDNLSYDHLGLEMRIAMQFALRILTGSSSRVTLRAGSDWRSVLLPDGVELDLSRRPVARRLVAALAEAHRQDGATRLSVDQLFASGWPGESLRPDRAAQRLYVALSALRKLGFADLLIKDDAGYGLASHLDIHVDE